MSLTGILTVIWYTLQPLLWLIILALAVLLTIQILARFKGYRIGRTQQTLSWLVALIIGVFAFFLAPAITGSTFAMVTTVFDWVALMGVAIGVILYSWLIVNPVIFLTGRRNG